MSEHTAGDEESEATVSTGLDDEEVRRRAWEISQGPNSGTPEENWQRAQEELRREQDEPSGE